MCEAHNKKSVPMTCRRAKARGQYRLYEEEPL